MINKKKRKIRKIWVAMSTPFQANFFAPLIFGLNKEYDFFVTARNHDNVLGILEAKGIKYTAVGSHGGKELDGKLKAYADTIKDMLPLVKDQKPDLLLTERWPEAVRVAFGLNIPAWTIFYDEREHHVNQMVFPLASKVFAPHFYSFHDLFKNGVADQAKVVWFNGFHTNYLKNYQIDNNNDPFKRLGIKHPIILVRPEPEFATFFPHHKPILEEAVLDLTRNRLVNGKEMSVLVIPRNSLQSARYSEMCTVLDRSIIDCPVHYADVVFGAAETMLMEAFTLCKPAVSSIYWAESKPVIELHKHIPHSTDPKVLSDTVQRCVEKEEQSRFRERMKVISATMDNPVEIIIDAIHRIDANLKPKTGSPMRRSRLEKLMDVVQATAMGPAKPTHVMKLANIPYSEFKNIALTLERKGLIDSESSFTGKFYKATNYGIKVLQDYREIKTRILD